MPDVFWLSSQAMASQASQADFFGSAPEARKYRVLEIIGKGSYGVVASAVDLQTSQKVAIKKIINVFDHVSDSTRILREIKLLRLLKHPGAAHPDVSRQPNCKGGSSQAYSKLDWMRLAHWPLSRTWTSEEVPSAQTSHLVQPASIDPLRCLPVLRTLADIVEIKHILLPSEDKRFKDIFVVFELMETDLHQVRLHGLVVRLPQCPWLHGSTTSSRAPAA
jgi:serine/threonine protein kinase